MLIVLAIPIEISSYLFLHEAKLIAKVIGILNVLCKLTNEEGKKEFTGLWQHGVKNGFGVLTWKKGDL